MKSFHNLFLLSFGVTIAFCCLQNSLPAQNVKEKDDFSDPFDNPKQHSWPTEPDKTIQIIDTSFNRPVPRFLYRFHNEQYDTYRGDIDEIDYRKKKQRVERLRLKSKRPVASSEEWDPALKKYVAAPINRWYWNSKKKINLEKPPCNVQWNEFETYYPDLYIGDVVPMFHRFYRVEKFNAKRLETTASIQTDNILVMQVSAKKLPKKISIQADSFTIPTGGKLVVPFPVRLFKKVKWKDTMEISFSKIIPKDKKPVPVVSLTMDYSEHIKISPGGYNVISHKKIFKAKIGDRLKHGGGEIVIRNIVPSNPKYKLIGYVEIEIVGLAKPDKKKAK